MVVVVERLHPSVAGLNGEPARHALGREELVPVLLAVRQPVLEVEGGVGEDLAAVGAHEALGVERAVHGLQGVLERKYKNAGELQKAFDLFIFVT